MPDSVGHAAFWCNNCMRGIVACRSIAPREGIRALRDSGGIPDYKIVAPLSISERNELADALTALGLHPEAG